MTLETPDKIYRRGKPLIGMPVVLDIWTSKIPTDRSALTKLLLLLLFETACAYPLDVILRHRAKNIVRVSKPRIVIRHYRYHCYRARAREIILSLYTAVTLFVIVNNNVIAAGILIQTLSRSLDNISVNPGATARRMYPVEFNLKFFSILRTRVPADDTRTRFLSVSISFWIFFYFLFFRPPFSSVYRNNNWFLFVRRYTCATTWLYSVVTVMISTRWQIDWFNVGNEFRQEYHKEVRQQEVLRFARRLCQSIKIVAEICRSSKT